MKSVNCRGQGGADRPREKGGPRDGGCGQERSRPGSLWRLEGGNRLKGLPAPDRAWAPLLPWRQSPQHPATPPCKVSTRLRPQTVSYCPPVARDTMTLGSQSVVPIGETETQRERRDWPEVPQGTTQKELRWSSGLLSPAQHQFSVREAYPVGAGTQNCGRKETGQRWDPKTPGRGDREAAGSRPRDLRSEA